MTLVVGRAPATLSPDAGATPLPCIVQLGRADWTPPPSALSQLASCCSPSPSSPSSLSSLSSSSYQLHRLSSRPTLPPFARSIMTSPQLLPSAVKPSVLTGFFSLSDEHHGEYVGRPTSICTGARGIYPSTLADPEGRYRHSTPSGSRPTFDPTWILRSRTFRNSALALLYIRTTMLVYLHILYPKCACQCHC